jgi:hypothetical protein
MMKYFLFLLISCATAGCIRSYTTPDGATAIPIQLAKPSYPIDVFFDNQNVEKNFESLGKVKVEQEVPLVAAQTRQGRMLYRGNDQDQKKRLLDQLILQAISKGAQALVNVKYSYYTSATHQGFVMEGTAVKYSPVFEK